MRRFIAIAAVITVVVALLVGRGVDTEPAITTSSPPAAVSGDLASLGPVDLVMNSYTPSFEAACVDLGEVAVYVSAFNASDLGSNSTITTAAANNGAAALAGGTVALIGATASGDCTPGSVDTVIGFLADGDNYTADIFIP